MVDIPEELTYDTVMQTGEARQTPPVEAEQAFTDPDRPRIIRFCA